MLNLFLGYARKPQAGLAAFEPQSLQCCSFVTSLRYYFAFCSPMRGLSGGQNIICRPVESGYAICSLVGQRGPMKLSR